MILPISTPSRRPFCPSFVQRWPVPSLFALTARPRRSPFSATTTTRSSCRTSCPRRRRSQCQSREQQQEFEIFLPGKKSHPHPQPGADWADLVVVARPRHGGLHSHSLCCRIRSWLSKSTKPCLMHHHNTVHKIVARPNLTQHEKS